MRLLKSKLKAATLIESLIAMVIIILCLGMATMIYSNVINSDKQRLKAKADGLLSRMALNVKKEKSYLDSEEIENEFILKKTVSKYPSTHNCYLLSITASVENKGIIATHRELIVIPE